MKRSPPPSTATPVGWSSSLAVAARPSPLKPAVPVPATVTAGAGPGSHLLDALRGGLRHVDVALLVDGHRRRVPDGRHAPVQLPPASVAACPARRCRPSSVPLRDGTTSDPAVTGVGDEEVTGRIERDPARRRRAPPGPTTVRTVGTTPPAAHRTRRAGESRPPTQGQGDEPGQGHGQSAHGAHHAGCGGGTGRVAGDGAIASRRGRPQQGRRSEHAPRRTDRRRKGDRCARTRRGPQRPERHVHRLRGRRDQRLPGPSRRRRALSPASWSSTTCLAGTRGPRRSRGASPPSGYNALCPNLYARQGLDVDPDDAAAATREAGGIPDDQFVGDADAAVEALRALPTSNGKVGVIGYCSGGRHSFLTAVSLPVDAAVDCYGAFVTGTVPDGFPLKVTPLVDRTPRPAAAPCSASSATTTSSPAPSRWTSWRRR